MNKNQFKGFLIVLLFFAFVFTVLNFYIRWPSININISPDEFWGSIFLNIFLMIGFIGITVLSIKKYREKK